MPSWIVLRPLCLLAALLLSGCGNIPTPQERTDNATRLAMQHGWQPFSIVAGRFELAGFSSQSLAFGEPLRVYIEGDGLAWISRNRPSPDPTPVTPTGLKLALADPASNTLYLGRPCQYLANTKCNSAYWLNKRFAPQVVESYNLALDRLKQTYNAASLALVGYSGGGAIAALLTAQRQDVDLLITVAGNLDPAYWTRHHQITPLRGSLNPANDIDRLSRVPQWHFVGEKDLIIPPAMIQQFSNRFPSEAMPHLIVVSGYNHHCCWADHWHKLLETIR